MLIVKSLAATWAFAVVANAGRSGLYTVDKPTTDQLRKTMTDKVKKIKDAMYDKPATAKPNDEQLRMAGEGIDALYQANPKLKSVASDGLYMVMLDTARQLMSYKKRPTPKLDMVQKEQQRSQAARGIGPPDPFEVVLAKRPSRLAIGGTITPEDAMKTFDQSKIVKKETRGIQRVYIWKATPSPGLEWVLCSEHRPWRPQGDQFYVDAVARVAQAGVDKLYAPDRLPDGFGPAADGFPKLFRSVDVPWELRGILKSKKPEYIGTQRVAAKSRAKDGVKEACGAIYQTALKQIATPAGQKAGAEKFWDMVFKAWRDANKGQRLYEAEKPGPSGKSPKKRL